MAIDYGERRIGVAISDPLMLTAQGLPNIDNDENKFSKIRKLIQDESVSLIVVGMPKNMDGSMGPIAQRVQAFVGELKKHVDVPIEYWDERFSTLQAQRHLISLDKSRRKRKNLVDRISAQIILQGYLDFLKKDEPDS